MEWSEDKTWNSIEMCVSFGSDKDEIEKNIKYLLSHFAREIKKQKGFAKSGTSTSETYQSKWLRTRVCYFSKKRINQHPH